MINENFWTPGDQYVVYPNLSNPLGPVTRRFGAVRAQLEQAAWSQEMVIGFCYRITAATPEVFWAQADKILAALKPLGVKQLVSDDRKAEMRRQGIDGYWIPVENAGLGYRLVNFYLRQVEAYPPSCVYVSGSAGSPTFTGDGVTRSLLPLVSPIEAVLYPR
ncbi:MAG TPA: hypothetical protein VNG90_01120 [Candidatus Acidoferrum sp.]|nr:hypothetical protein [Candidatus Acidoferrum sp.]